ncbi:MAG: glycosyltransferase family 2 protein [Acidimicrobiales bacterium]
MSVDRGEVTDLAAVQGYGEGGQRSAGASGTALQLLHTDLMVDTSSADAPLPARAGWRVARGDVEVIFNVSVVIPCVNEALNLPSVLSQMPPGVVEVVIVDGESTDGTADIAREIRPDVIIIERDRTGKGDALKAGFEACTGDIIVMLDGDGSMSPREIGSMVMALANGADMVKGSRNLEEGHSADLTFIRDMGNRALSGLFNLIFDASHTDLCYGYLAFWRKHLWALTPNCAGFEVETFLNVRANRAGFHVVEVPSKEGRRLYGESNLNPIRDGLRIVRTMYRERRAPRPVPITD